VGAWGGSDMDAVFSGNPNKPETEDPAATSKSDIPRGVNPIGGLAVVASAAGFIPCVRRCRLALDRMANDLLQPSTGQR